MAALKFDERSGSAHCLGLKCCCCPVFLAPCHCSRSVPRNKAEHGEKRDPKIDLAHSAPTPFRSISRALVREQLQVPLPQKSSKRVRKVLSLQFPIKYRAGGTKVKSPEGSHAVGDTPGRPDLIAMIVARRCMKRPPGQID